jgi:hypothetical protein
MGTGIWAIAYNLQEESRQDYLTWFHEVHIPEKLSRPGYRWAAHFESMGVEDPRKPTETPSSGATFLALFGGETTRTFFDPSPSQLKQRQDELTRNMIGKRVGATSFVYTVEWNMGQSGPDTWAGKGAAFRFIRMERFIDPAKDEEIEVWCAQERSAQASSIRGCLGTTKLLAVIGMPRHGLIFEFSDLGRAETLQFFSNTDPEPQTPFLLHGSPFSGRRIWPSV